MVVVIDVGVPIGGVPVAGFSCGVLIPRRKLELGPAMAAPRLGVPKPDDRGRRRLDGDHGFRVGGLGRDALLLLPLLRLHYLNRPPTYANLPEQSPTHGEKAASQIRRRRSLRCVSPANRSGH